MSSKAPKTDVGNTTVPGDSYYTNLHLSAVASLYPPTPRNVKHMCESKLSPETQTEQSKLIRVYYTEPSYFGYNPGSYLIKETRYGVQQEWHAASDELVADDAAPGSPVAAVGWCASSADGQGFEDTWETRVYYMDINGNIRERVNHSSFKPTTVDEFDAELHKPEELIPPTPGWKQTPLYSGGSNTKSNGTTFPVISPLPTTKLTAIHFDTGYIYVFYQEVGASIHVLVSQPGQGWQMQSGEVVNSQMAKPGAPLSAIVGGWNEVRLFYVTPQDELGEAYMDNHTPWVKTKMPSYNLGNSTAMISAVAWNYASPFFQIRIYVAGERNELQEYSFSRNADGVSRDTDGWIVPNQTPIGSVSQRTLRPNVPLSAVAAVMLENGCNPKVYFHPRSIIAEWDVCAKTMFPASLAKVGEKSIARRNIEEETRVKIQEEEERKREEQKKREEEIKREEARKREEEKQKQEMTKVKVGQKVPVNNQALLDKIKNQSGCEMGYEWEKTENGWKCAGGGHKLTDAQFAAL